MASYRNNQKFEGGQVVGTLELSKESISSNGHTIYTTIKWSDGSVTCNCPGWGVRKTCKHMKASVACGCRDMVSPNELTATRRTVVTAKATPKQAEVRRAKAIQFTT